jgi:hypothetical protein
MSDNKDDKPEENRRVSTFALLWQLIFGYKDNAEDEPPRKENKNGKNKQG